MSEFVQVSVNVPTISGVFDYHVPAELKDSLYPGCLVVVPFGTQIVQGVVIKTLDETDVPETKAVQALLDPQPVLLPQQIDLASWLSKNTLSPLSACIDLMLPPGLSQQADTLYSINPQPPPAPNAPSTLQNRIINVLIKRGPLRGRQLEAAFLHLSWKLSAQGLIKQGTLISQPVLPPPSVHPKFIRTAQLSAPLERALLKVAELSKTPATLTRRTAILNYLKTEALPVHVDWVYAASGADLQDLKLLAEEELIILGETEVWRDPLAKMDWQPVDPPALTQDQCEALKIVLEGLGKVSRGIAPVPCLLHGVTGSGKTEIYLQTVAETLKLGKHAIILVPEISMTPQTVRRFASRFPGQIGLIHSKLSPGERYDTWRRIRAGLLPVVIGPRSALFAPLPNLGLIVVDECHDDSYSQDDLPPFYGAVDAALEYARLQKAVILLGSATPSVTMLYRAEREGWERLGLPVRILAHRQAVEHQVQELHCQPVHLTFQKDAASLPLPSVQIVDMREELKAGNRSVFSRALQQALAATLNAHQQAILFLNRRGSASYIFCRNCGYSLRCPRCDLSLTWHAGQNNLICHTCGYRRNLPSTCPNCNSDQIKQYGMGTESVEKLVKELFPSANVLRWDAETTREKGAHEIILSHFINHRADILVGTQMLAKGLDLPLVTLVGAMLADSGLNLPDYRAAERTFQLLTQVAGRAGRSPLGGTAILQTFQPEHYAIQSAAHHDSAGFYHQELGLRRAMGYPPFSSLVRIEVRNIKPELAEQKANQVARQLQMWIKDGNFNSTEMIGPVPCFFAKQNGLYRWQIILRGPDPVQILQGKNRGELRVTVNPTDLL
jgi:primosomal protein N' (replication factor Y)